MSPKALRQFDEVHIEEDHSQSTGVKRNHLYFGCDFKKLNGLELVDCDLNRSRFNTTSIADALNFTLTLSCHSFTDVEFSPLLVELLLYLLTTTRGNDGYREKIASILGPHKMEALKRVLREIE